MPWWSQEEKYHGRGCNSLMERGVVGWNLSGRLDCQDQRGFVKAISFQQYQVVFMAPMEVRCAIGSLTVPLDSNWPFHSSFSTFPNGVKEELPRSWKCWGNWGTKTFLMYCEVINSINVFNSTVRILLCGYHKEMIITCNSKSGSSYVMNSLWKRQEAGACSEKPKLGGKC